MNEHVGTMALKVTATDSGSASVTDTFNLTVTNTNDAPTLVNPIVDYSFIKNQEINLQFASDVFADVDAGDSFTSATLSDDSAMAVI